ncbi:MAG: DUF1573 domain-containing protein [Anaerolineales bacterium]|nr:DUF1573 domain-containing protein [Anaerolineales bacterium]
MNKGILITFILAGMILTACAGGEPQINLETTNFDFGDVVNGDVLERDLVVNNEGNQPIIAQSVSTTCGCTTATLEPMTIPAGGSANLHITFDSGAHGPELTGQITRQIFITSNDPDQPEAMVEFTANIVDKETP